MKLVHRKSKKDSVSASVNKYVLNMHIISKKYNKIFKDRYVYNMNDSLINSMNNSDRNVDLNNNNNNHNALKKQIK